MRQATEDGENPTQHTDEERLVDQLVALWVDQVELERQAAPLLPFFMAVLQQACKPGAVFIICIETSASNYHLKQQTTI